LPTMLKQPDKFSQLSSEEQNGILILDSGLGSLSLLIELRKLMPHVSITAVADNEAFPYGTKSEEEVIERVLALAKVFIPKVKPATILVACNTASTIALPQLRALYSIPIVGAVPAIKPAAQISKTGTIALLATPGTVGRCYVDRLIEDFAAHCNVVRFGCSELAALAEKKMFGLPVNKEEVLRELEPLLGSDQYSEIDCLIFGCTHFTFLKDEIQAVIKEAIDIVDPAISVARQVQRVHRPVISKGKSRLVFTEQVSDMALSSTLGIDRIFCL
jgi:glutamate racemase